MARAGMVEWLDSLRSRYFAGEIHRLTGSRCGSRSRPKLEPPQRWRLEQLFAANLEFAKLALGRRLTKVACSPLVVVGPYLMAIQSEAKFMSIDPLVPFRLPTVVSPES